MTGSPSARWIVVLLVALLAALAVLLSLLAHLLRPRPTALFISSDCALPCWRGISPGSTTRDDALAALREMEDIKEVAAYTHISFWFTEDVNDMTGLLRLQDGRVERIILNSSIPLDQAFSRLGLPTQYCAHVSNVAEATLMAVFLFYPSGIELSVVRERNVIFPSTPFTIDDRSYTGAVNLFPPTEFRTVVEDACSHPPSPVRQWAGYDILVATETP